MIKFRKNEHDSFYDWLISYLSVLAYGFDTLIYLITLGAISSFFGDNIWFWLNRKLEPEEFVWPNS